MNQEFLVDLQLKNKINKRLEQIRKSARAGNISYGELAELQSLAKYVELEDVELLELAGVPEFEEETCKDCGGELQDCGNDKVCMNCDIPL